MSKKEKSIVNASAVVGAPDLNSVVQAISDQTYGLAKISEGGIIQNTDELKAVFEKNLPDGLDIKTVRKVEDYKSFFGAGTMDGIGRAAVDGFRADENLQAVSFDARAGGDRIDLSISRTGAIDARYINRGVGSSGSQLGQVRSHLSNLLKSEFGPKSED